jgi:hypothetical protein
MPKRICCILCLIYLFCQKLLFIKQCLRFWFMRYSLLDYMTPFAAEVLRKYLTPRLFRSRMYSELIISYMHVTCVASSLEIITWLRSNTRDSPRDQSRICESGRVCFWMIIKIASLLNYSFAAALLFKFKFTTLKTKNTHDGIRNSITYANVLIQE